MKAIRVHEFGGPEVLNLEEVATPKPSAGQVLVLCRKSGYFSTEDPRQRDIFSDTAVLNLRHGRVSGLGILTGALKTRGEFHISVFPLLIGTGGWNLYPD